MKILQGVRPEDIIFIDIETVPSESSFDVLEQHIQLLWEKKSKQFRREDESAGDAFNRAGIYAEFGKIICISAGVITGKDPFFFRLKSFYGDDEKLVLSGFSSMLAKFSRNREALLCAHNGKEFDYPYISRRMIINSIAIPDLLDIAGRKPWEIKLIDTMDLWKFGDYKSYTSLDLLTSVLKIQSPKDDIDGSMVADLYYREGELKRIVRYCEKDVLAVAQVFLRFLNMPQISRENVESVTLW